LVGVYYRHLARPLWYVGLELTELRKRWKQRIPLIQLLAYNKQKGMPGTGGLNWLLKDLLTPKRRNKLSREERLAAVETMWNTIFRYERWLDVLRAFKMRPYRPPIPDGSKIARRLLARYRPGSGEGLDHLRLKYFVSDNPRRIRLPHGAKLECIEYLYPSLDRVDVLFRFGEQRFTVEVKPKNALDDEIARGMYQCVKYQALSEAISVSESRRPNVRSVLVLGGRLPPALVSLKKALRLQIVENVQVPQDTGCQPLRNGRWALPMLKTKCIPRLHSPGSTATF
jgi:hypothetical protein